MKNLPICPLRIIPKAFNTENAKHRAAKPPPLAGLVVQGAAAAPPMAGGIVPYAAAYPPMADTLLQGAAQFPPTIWFKNIKNLKPNKKMIQSIDLYNLRNGEFLQLMTDILAIILKNNPDELKVRKQYEALLALNNQTESLFKISQGSAVTQLLLDLDARRDNAIVGLGYLITGFGYSSDPVVAGNAKILADHLGLFGSGIARDNFLSETASIRNVVNDYNNKPELQAPITALNLGSWKAELDAANNAFSKAYMDRSEEMAGASADTLKAKRNETNAAYYNLRDTINAYFTLGEGAEPYASVINLVNAYIDQYNVLISGRIGKAPKNTTPQPAVIELNQ